MKKTFLFLILISMISCNAVLVNNLQIGMSKNEVIQTLQRKPDNTLFAKQYSSGIMVIHKFSRAVPAYNEVGVYYLYFFNDKLVMWEPAQPDYVDLNLKADYLYESLSRK